MSAPDPELLTRYVQSGSQEAFTTLVQRHFPIVHSAALRQSGGDADRAKDVAQIVFTDLARKAPTLLRRPSLTGWLYTSTRFAALHAMRAERRRQRREQEAHAMHITDSPTASADEWERLKPMVDDVLHGLNESDREVVLLRFFHGQPFAEIGDRLGLTADGARFKVDRALKRMRTAFARHGVTSTSIALAVALTSQASAMQPADLAAEIASAALREAGKVGIAPASTGFIHFMATSKTALAVTVVVLGIVIVGEGALATSQSREIAALASALQAEPSQGFALPLARAQTSIAPTNPELSAPAKLGAASTTVIRPSATGPAPAGAPEVTLSRPLAANASEAFSLAMNDPEFRRLLAVVQKARLPVYYSALFAELNLDPERLDRFKELLVDKQQSVGDANRRALELGMNTDAARDAIGSAQAQIDADLRSLLGPEAFDRYLGYERTHPERMVVDQLRQTLSYGTAPLSDADAARLLDILVQSTPPTKLPRGTGIGAQIAAGILQRDISAPVSDRGLAAAQGFLSTTQIAALQLLQYQQRERARIVETLQPYATKARQKAPRP